MGRKEKMIAIHPILKCFPLKVAKKIEDYFLSENINLNLLEEIRIRTNRPILLKVGQEERKVEHVISQEEILETLQHICDNSIYSYQSQICKGYITMQGGHRVGITGNAIIKEGQVSNINYISSLNFRIAKQVLGASNKILKYVINEEENSVFNTLIVSPPGAGKTTILRDLVRKISSGMEQINFKGITVGLIDERGEIAAMSKGISQNEVGLRTDVLDNVPKYLGMQMMIRSMAPKVIVADEIGNKNDVDTIEYAVCCGIKGIFTVHGKTMEDIKLNPSVSKLINSHIFERLIFLDESKKGEISAVYNLNKINAEYVLM